jgi:hypothetical protein
VCTLVIALCIASVIGVISMKKLGNSDADKMLDMMCRTGEQNLEVYFESVEKSVAIVSKLVQDSLEDMPFDQLESRVERSRDLFGEVAYNTNGVLTYYFRIDPEISKK